MSKSYAEDFAMNASESKSKREPGDAEKRDLHSLSGG